MPHVEQLNAALIGRYEIEREIGRGGMATVYLARDQRHHRQVALKVLDPELGAVLGADRFLGEIRVTANLQHPNLLPLFDSGEASGLLFYVMPFVEGETLRARITREKQLPVVEAVRISTGIANALDYAHRHGVIHRDLKPENILLQDGEPLIADFGIALAVSKAGGTRVTQTGLSLGTPQYMSPEQATGDRNIDNRTDIYSLGAVTYEMLSGEPPHSGTTAQAIIARLMTEEPRPLTSMRRAIPEHVEAAVQCSLEKLPADRFQTAKEFAEALNGRAVAFPSSTRPVKSTKAASKTSWTTISAVAVIALLSAGAAWMAATKLRAEPSPVRMEVSPAAGTRITDPAGVSVSVSDDGKMVAYIGADARGVRNIYTRKLSDWEPRLVTGTDGAFEPSFSPDGNWLLFGAAFPNEARKVTVDGSLVTTLQKGLSWSGGRWGSDGTIVIAVSDRVLAFGGEGGTPRMIVKSDSVQAKREGLNDPLVIQSEGIIAFRRTTLAGSGLATIPLGGGTVTRFDFPLSNPIGYDRGWLIFGRSDGTIAAVELKKKGTVLGNRVVPLLENVAYKGSGGVVASLSRSGTLAYLSGSPGGHIALFSTEGRTTFQGADLQQFAYPRFSPDGKKIALSKLGQTLQNDEIWVLDLPTNTLSRVTRGFRPEWTPDGKRILFLEDSTRAVWSIPADASGGAEKITSHRYSEIVLTPDGKNLIGRTNNTGGNGADLEIISLDSPEKAEPLVNGAGAEINPRVSPDGKWLAFSSNESGNFEVYVRPLKGGSRTQVSATGGVQPVWGAAGKRIYYTKASRMYVADVQDGGSSLNVVKRDSLFSAAFDNSNNIHQQYDLSPDGKTFVGILPNSADIKLRVVTNWLSEVRQKLK